MDAATFGELQIPVIGSVHASALHSADLARADIKAQMQSRVRWTETVQILVGQGINTFIEVGTGTVLGGLIKRIASEVVNSPLGTPQDFTALE